NSPPMGCCTRSRRACDWWDTTARAAASCSGGNCSKWRWLSSGWWSRATCICGTARPRDLVESVASQAKRRRTRCCDRPLRGQQQQIGLRHRALVDHERVLRIDEAELSIAPRRKIVQPAHGVHVTESDGGHDDDVSIKQLDPVFIMEDAGFAEFEIFLH